MLQILLQVPIITPPSVLALSHDLFEDLRVSVCMFRDRVSLYSLDWPGTPYVDQAGFELRDICLLLPPTPE